MATAAEFCRQQTFTDSNEPKTGFPPPGYYPMSQPVHTGGTPPFIGIHTTQPSTMGTTVVVTQPVVTGPEPNTTCSLVMSVLTVVFCCSICGMAGILVAWKARLDVLEKKYEQARHSVRIAWLFFGLAVFFWLLFVLTPTVTLLIVLFSV